MIDMKKFNLGRLWFPKLINLWGFISTFIIYDFKLQTVDKYFIFQLFGIGDDAMVETSLFQLYIEYGDELEIKLNILFLFHLKYEYSNKWIYDLEEENQPWNFKKL